MIMITTSHVILKVLAWSLMLSLNEVFLLLYICGDLFIYMCYKLSMRDLRYWFRLNGFLGWAISITERVVVKLVVDFTLMVQMRHRK